MDRRTALKALVVGGGAALASEPKPAEARRSPPADAVVMLYDATRCIGCQTCVVKCREANGLPPQPDAARLHDTALRLDAHTKTVIKVYSEGSAFSFVKANCMHCVDPACASACMLGALAKREHGIVTWDADRCIGCRNCQVACPYGVPAFEWSSPAPKIVKCEMCQHLLAEGKRPACVAVCPREAIVFGPLADVTAEARARLAAEPKRYVPQIYGEKEGGGTQVLLLAGVPFEKLGLPALGAEAVPHLAETIQHALYQGFLLPGALFLALGGVILRNHSRRPEENKEQR